MKSLEDYTSQCIRCGFCLEACPTFLVTGDEADSPRGRIYLTRSAIEGKASWLDDVKPHMDRCLGCLACETACPSGVEYRHIFEGAREQLAETAPDGAKERLLAGITNPHLFRLQVAAANLLPGRKAPNWLASEISGEPQEAQVPIPQSSDSWPQLEVHGLPKVQGEVWLLEGCAMGVLFEGVHQATERLLRRLGFRARRTGSLCCGALDLHSGFAATARQKSDSLMGSLPKDAILITNSAGCGSALKDGGAGKVMDASEFLLANGLAEALAKSRGLKRKVTYHDACHLAHGQRVQSQPRALLESVPGIQLVKLRESEVCCGSAGIYNVQQPKIARQLLERKWANIETTGADIVASGNPGCHAWIEQAARERGSAIRVMHTLEVLEAAFSGPPE